MLTRRGFTAFASCAICTLTGFAATEVAAQGAPAAAQGLRRKVLSQADGPAPGYVTIVAEVEIDPDVLVGRHTHPGIESGYILEGEIELPIEGQPTKVYKVGDAFQVPPNTPHAGSKSGAKRVRVASTFVVEKGKPLATPA